MKLSIIILNFNVCHFLELCLKSVQAAISNIEAEIIVVDNNSLDESCKMVKNLFPNVKLIENQENLGFSKGNNIGVNMAEGEFLCILNPDTVVAEDTFISLLKFVKSKPIGIIGCQLVDGSGSFLPESKRAIPTPRIALEKLIGRTKNYYANDIPKNGKGKVDVLVGAFMLMRKEVYQEVGGFDEDYFMYGEDIDLSYKVLNAGYTNYYYGETTIIHYKGESTLKDEIYAKHFFGAMDIFYRKHFKSNLLMSALVKLGLKIASMRKNRVEELETEIQDTVLISNTEHQKLDQTLKLNSVRSSLDHIKSNTRIILDSDFLSFGQIINFMKHNSHVNQISFRILLKNSNFILGSDSSTSRGEVQYF